MTSRGIAVAAGFAVAGCSLLWGFQAPNDADGGADASADGSDAATAAAPDVIFGDKLVLWLDADQADTVVTDADAGGRVLAWKDRTSYGNDGRLVYSSANARVRLEAAAPNGRRALAFSGAWSATGVVRVLDSPSLQFGVGDFLIVEVVAYDNAPGTDEFGGRAQLWAKSGGVWPYWGHGLVANAFSAPLPDGGAGGPDSLIFGGVKSFADGPASGAWSAKNGWNDGAFHAFTLRKDGASKHAYVRTDGAETQSPQPIDALHNLSAVGGDVWIAGDVVSGACCYDPLSGHLAEVIAVKGSSGTTAELARLSAYVQAKYGLVL